MVDHALETDLRDVAAGILTPFDRDDPTEIRHDELANVSEWLVENGISLLLACANISEYHSLTHDERIETVHTVCESVGREATILAGAGGSLQTAIDLARAHEDHGADGIMVMPPDHAFKHVDGVVDYYHRIATAVDIGIVPYFRGFELPVSAIVRIAEHENVAGVKWAIPKVELFSECVAAAPDEVVWLCGMAEPPAPAYFQEGAEGFSAGVTNFEPRLGLAMLDALEAGELDRARELRDLSHPLMDLRADAGDGFFDGAYSVQVVKHGLELAGQYGGAVRPPLVPLSDSRRERVEQRYEELQEQLEELGVQSMTTGSPRAADS